MPRLGVWSLLLALTGCASPCEDAQARLESCQDAIRGKVSTQGYASRPISIGDECSGANECRAECVNDASCEDLARVIGGPAASDPNDPASEGAAALNRCLDGCGQ